MEGTAQLSNSPDSVFMLVPEPRVYTTLEGPSVLIIQSGPFCTWPSSPITTFFISFGGRTTSSFPLI